MDRSSSRHGSAIAVVAVFLLFVAIVAVATSLQTGSVRRMTNRSHHGFEAIELCESAINEAFAQIKREDVFTPSLFKNGMKDFVLLVQNDDRGGLESNFPGFSFQFRTVRDANGSPIPGPKNEIFASMAWPQNDSRTAKNFAIPETLGEMSKLVGFTTKKLTSTFGGEEGKVTMSPVSWRRDWLKRNWQDWGVMRFSVKCYLDDGHTPVTRTMYADRMFAILACDEAKLDGECGGNEWGPQLRALQAADIASGKLNRPDNSSMPPVGPDVGKIIHLIFVTHAINLTTVIERS